MKYTIKDFKKDYPDDKTCLAAVFQNKYPKGIECVKCQRRDSYYPIAKRKDYVCSWCGNHVSPTAGTIFHKSPTPLTSWFYAIFLMGQSKNGVSAKEIERHLGVTYKCAWRICKQIRLMMKSDGGPLSGIVEADETYFGGRVKGQYGPRAGGKVPIFGVVQRGGRIKAKVVPNVKRKTLLPELKAAVEPGTKINTDDNTAYTPVEGMGFPHDTINHRKQEYVRGSAYTNTIEGFWSQLKRSINGTYHTVSKKHLPSYLDEFAFRYDHRRDLAPLPLTLFSRVARPV